MHFFFIMTTFALIFDATRLDYNLNSPFQYRAQKTIYERGLSGLISTAVVRIMAFCTKEVTALGRVWEWEGRVILQNPIFFCHCEAEHSSRVGPRKIVCQDRISGASLRAPRGTNVVYTYLIIELSLLWKVFLAIGMFSIARNFSGIQKR